MSDQHNIIESTTVVTFDQSHDVERNKPYYLTNLRILSDLTKIKRISLIADYHYIENSYPSLLLNDQPFRTQPIPIQSEIVIEAQSDEPVTIKYDIVRSHNMIHFKKGIYYKPVEQLHYIEYKNPSFMVNLHGLNACPILSMMILGSHNIEKISLCFSDYYDKLDFESDSDLGEYRKWVLRCTPEELPLNSRLEIRPYTGSEFRLHLFYYVSNILMISDEWCMLRYS